MILLVDGDSLVWRSVATGSDFTHGWIVQKILGISDSYDPEALIVIWDDLSERRKEIYPDYKAQRHVDEELLAKKKTLKNETIESLRICGIPQCRVEGEEGDDVIATFVNNIFSDEQILICSNDKDYYSLLSKRVKIWNWKEEYDEFKFRGEYQINPEDWIKLRSLMGDSSDNIKGVYGIGPKKGLEIIKNGNYGDYENQDDVQLSKKLLSFFDIDEDKISSGMDFGSIDFFKIKQLCEVCRMNYDNFSTFVWTLYNKSKLKKWRISSLESEMESCDRCKLREKAKNVVCFSGDINSEIMIIGEAPGKEEDETGIPFIGKAGDELDRWLRRIGLDRNSLLISNVCWCRPVDKHGENKAPTEKHVSFCSQYGIERLIKYVNPKFIILLGKSPSTYFMNTKIKVTRDYGKYNVTKWGMKFVVWILLHPAALLYQKDQEGIVFDQLREMGEYLRKEGYVK